MHWLNSEDNTGKCMLKKISTFTFVELMLQEANKHAVLFSFKSNPRENKCIVFLLILQSSFLWVVSVCCRIITKIHMFMPMLLLSIVNLSAGKKGGNIFCFLCYQKADTSKKKRKKGRAKRWVCVSLWPIKGFCSVLSSGDSFYSCRLLWQTLFICLQSAGGPVLAPQAIG